VVALIAVCAASLGIYFNQDELFGQGTAASEQPAVQEQQQSQPVTGITIADSTTDTETTASGGSSTRPPMSTTQETASSAPERRVARTQSNTASNSNTSSDEWVFQDGQDKVVINGKSIRSGNVKIVNGKIITPEGEFPLNKQFQQLTPMMPKIPPVQIDPRTLTPEQRQRLRMLRQNHPEVFVKPPPQPTPTPDN
jgi:hypothetical protein